MSFSSVYFELSYGGTHIQPSELRLLDLSDIVDLLKMLRDQKKYEEEKTKRKRK